jgi:hypothetical protein
MISPSLKERPQATISYSRLLVTWNREKKSKYDVVVYTVSDSEEVEVWSISIIMLRRRSTGESGSPLAV